MFKQIKQNLPNFPDEIIIDWLLPRAEDLGWPPSGMRWDAILLNKDLNFWRSVFWKQVDVNLTEINLEKITQKCIDGYREAYEENKKNIFSTGISDGRSRYICCLEYLLEHGKFPKPICLLQGDGEYLIADGHHRFAAWKLNASLYPIQKVWLATEGISKNI
jgi:hypothetical protein